MSVMPDQVPKSENAFQMTPEEIKLHLEDLYSYARPRILDQLHRDEVLTNTFSTALQTDSSGEDSAKHDAAWLERFKARSSAS